MNVTDTYWSDKIKYCDSLTSYQRRKTREVKIGDIGIGGHHPIRLQSMTTVDTMDTEGSIAQSIRMIKAGCELVRITAPSVKEAQNLQAIKDGLRSKGYTAPLVADIHFTPNAAELAARIVEKVRVNPGNYADKKKFEQIEYTDSAYQEELDRIREKFTPLVQICKEYGTAMRIGTNHGSLSDRIMSRYGDTPKGMVESALEFIRICEDLNYYNLVVSMKSSNPQVMVQAYRLLVFELQAQGLKPYPLHLGVTEAGEAEDGRIKSAVGIGSLLEDGLGDTVRVSLTEEPEAEIPVAAQLVNRLIGRQAIPLIKPLDQYPIDPYGYARRKSLELQNFGDKNVPRVLADFSAIQLTDKKQLKGIGHFYLPELDKWAMNDVGADYIYTGNTPTSFMLPNGLREIIDIKTWENHADQQLVYPLFSCDEWFTIKRRHAALNFLRLSDLEYFENIDKIDLKNVVVVLHTYNPHAMSALRRVFVDLMARHIEIPVVIERNFDKLECNAEQTILYASTDIGGLLIEGLGEGTFIRNEKGENSVKSLNELAFGILQAARMRITKTEYISCPSCGRTLFDLQETTAMIRKRTDHLKGIKIGIMGCIVNGPGEMADADYGYVGSGKDKITLYKGKEVVKRNVPAAKALDELIELIKQNGEWLEPQQNPSFN